MRSIFRLLSRSLRSLNRFNIIPYVFLGFMLRLTIQGASIGDAIAALAICALVGGKLFLDSKRKPDHSKHLSQELFSLKEEVAMLKLGNSKKQAGFAPRPDQRLF